MVERVTLAIQVILLGDEGSLPVVLELEARDDSLTDTVKDQRLSEIIKRTPNPVGRISTKAGQLQPEMKCEGPAFF